MRLHFIWVGKTKDRNWRALQDEYLQRLSHFVKCSVTEIKDKAVHESVEAEGERILDKVNQSAFVCALDVKGRSIGSRKLASKIADWQVRSVKEIAFVIGGAEGLSPAVVERADFSLSLSFLTFTHEMARVILLEQLYRSFTIIKGYPYQK